MLINVFYFLFIFLVINFFLKKNRLFLNKPIKKHKKLIPVKNTPISGGGFFLIIIIFFTDLQLDTKIICSFIYLLGMFSDLNKINSPQRRFFFQVLLIIIYLISTNNVLLDFRIPMINEIILNNNYIAILLTTFCFLVLINGTNFMDGVNGFVATYYIFILIIILLFKNEMNLEMNVEIIKIMIIALMIFLFFNLLSKTLFGDGGAYLVSFVIGFFLIEVYLKNPHISPYFIVILLWYPAYENLFSIIRKKILKIKVSDPDNNHLHQLIYYFLKKKNYGYANSITGIMLSIFNLLVFLFAVRYFDKTNILILIILSNVLLYNFLYILLYLKKKSLVS